MNRRPSVLRRIAAIVAALIAVIAWLAAVVVWTSTARVTSAGDFAQVTVETIQTPAGSAAVTDSVMGVVDTYAPKAGFDLTPSARQQIQAQLTQAIQSAQFPGLVGPAVEAARNAYASAPDGPITIDLAALRPLAVEKVSAVNPDLVKAIPPAQDLSVTVQKQDVPSVVSTAVGATSAFRWMPLWLLLGTLVFGALALWASIRRGAMAMVLGIAAVVVALVPVVLRFVVPPIVGSFADPGNPEAIASSATEAILANWWIAFVVSLLAGIALIAWGVYAGRRRPGRSDPVVLGR